MRNYSMIIRLAAGMVAPLLLACDTNSTGGGGVVTVPTTCVGGALTTDSTGQLQCVPLPAGAVSLPNCQPNIEALTADGTNLTCVVRNNIDATTQMFLNTLTMIEKQIMDYGKNFTMIGAGPASQAVYQGMTTQTYTGRITYQTTTPGIASAAAACAVDFGKGAHMCTPYELYYSAALLKNIDTTNAISGGWVYMQSWKTPGGAGVPEASAGLSDNCGGYTSMTAGSFGGNQWTGTTFRYVASTYTPPVGQGSVALVPKFDATTSCATPQPIVCCK